VRFAIKTRPEPTTTLAGRYVQLTEARCEPKPIQQPHPPITIGGLGPKRTLLAVAKYAQWWNAITPSPEVWLGSREILHAHCAAIGRDPAEIRCSVNVRFDPDTSFEEAIASAAAYAEAGADLVVMKLPHRAEPSILEPLANALREIG
jgi:alkanesulfonate monooxygenase SsuD/methylene tetrahydromethanopterin reductase-like flavin-dependent oxidoreductase (luciferase family)